ncbi:hypothetical protein LUW77_00900 [Streptomyces radiopugnans]|nr:hypothetical protein LUW77_00900 [Streptomyces radiopugnans]
MMNQFASVLSPEEVAAAQREGVAAQAYCSGLRRLRRRAGPDLHGAGR